MTPAQPVIEIVLAGKPMAKERVKPNTHFGATHHYTPERTVAYEGRFALAAQHVMAGRPLLTGALVLDVVAFMPIPQSKPKAWLEAARRNEIRPTGRPDWDNFGKILDGLNMQVWADDAQIVRGTVDKFYSDRPMMVVRVRSMDVVDHVVPGWATKFQKTDVFGDFPVA